MEEYTYTKKDFKVEWFSGQGAGGQARNKNQNCCRITHKQTGLKAQGVDHRNRVANQRDAFNRLAKLIIAHHKIQEIKEINEEVIRTYHAERNEVRDKVSEKRIQFSDLDDEFGELIKARKEALGDDS